MKSRDLLAVHEQAGEGQRLKTECICQEAGNAVFKLGDMEAQLTSQVAVCSNMCISCFEFMPLAAAYVHIALVHCSLPPTESINVLPASIA